MARAKSTQTPAKQQGRPHKRPARIESTQAEMRPVLCSVKRSAELLDLGKTKVNELIASDQIASVCVGRRRLIPYAELVRFSQYGTA
jgi:excisionase family DNA binding protein